MRQNANYQNVQVGTNSLLPGTKCFNMIRYILQDTFSWLLTKRSSRNLLEGRQCGRSESGFQ